MLLVAAGPADAADEPIFLTPPACRASRLADRRPVGRCSAHRSEVVRRRATAWPNACSATAGRTGCRILEAAFQPSTIVALAAVLPAEQLAVPAASCRCRFSTPACARGEDSSARRRWTCRARPRRGRVTAARADVRAARESISSAERDAWPARAAAERGASAGREHRQRELPRRRRRPTSRSSTPSARARRRHGGRHRRRHAPPRRLEPADRARTVSVSRTTDDRAGAGVVARLGELGHPLLASRAPAGGDRRAGAGCTGRASTRRTARISSCATRKGPPLPRRPRSRRRTADLTRRRRSDRRRQAELRVAGAR